MRAALLAFLAACSVPITKFTPAAPPGPDAPGSCEPQVMHGSMTHDEDSDGIPDAIDVCPHIADAAQTDTDCDGVGDACDPAPTDPRQKILFFAAMTPAEVLFVPQKVWTMQPDAWRNDDSSGTNAGDLTHADQFTDLDLTMRATIVAMPGALGHLAISINPPTTTTTTYYYAELTALGNPMPSSYAAISEYNGSSYMTLTKLSLANGLHTGALTFHIAARTASPTWRFDATWDGEATQTVTAATPAYVGDAAMDIRNQNLETDIDWVIAIATKP